MGGKDKPADPVTAYAQRVIAGEIVAGELVKAACRRHLADLETAEARGWNFNLAKAMRAIEFFPTACQHYKGDFAGAPFVLEPWEAFIIGSAFGWVSIETGLRRFRVVYVEIPRKNGKSALVAGVGLILLVFDNEAGPEIYSAATKRDQARIVWGDAAKFVRKSKALSRRITLFQHSMLCPGNDGIFVPLSADDKTMDGLNPHGTLIDELHRHPSRAIVDVLETAQGARAQPLQFEITTAGNNVESVCWDHHEYSVKVNDGTHEDDRWFAYIAAADKTDDWRKEETWRKANPNLGISKSLDYMRSQYTSAKNQPAKQTEFKRLHLNIWTEEAGGWMSMDKWNACAGEVTDERLRGRDCFGGIDLSAKVDVTAYVEVYPPTPADPVWLVRPTLWVPEAKVLEARQGEARDRVRYDLWEERGLIRATPGDVVDYNAMFDEILARSEIVKIRQIGFDAWNATQLANNLLAEGFELVEVGQGFKSMSEPTKKLMELVLAGLIAHGGHPVLRWMASNMSVKTDDAGNQKPSKRLSRQRIDGIVALIIALQRAIASEPTKGPSVYEERGVIVL
jgi:phage terminase large subunit-like protein